MDVRDSTSPLVVAARDGLGRFNARHPWSHNEHFHPWIVRALPPRRRAAADIGCGAGLLAGRLAPHFARVTAVDADAGMAAAARSRLAREPGVTVRHEPFAAFAATPGTEALDLITMVAVLHHLALDETLAAISRLLAPGGRLLVVGLARPDSLPDLAVDLASSLANPLMGLVKHPRPAGPARDLAGERPPAMPVRAPETTLADIARSARTWLPGIVIRRRLYFRYTLRWDKPPAR